MSWKDNLPQGVINFMNDIIAQIPEANGTRIAFERALDKIAEVKGEDARRLSKLTALEAGGVDNWGHYADSLESAGWFDSGDDDDEDERG